MARISEYIELACVGCQYQKENNDLFSSKEVPDKTGVIHLKDLSIVAETDNKYNPNALAIMYKGKHKLGYIPDDSIEEARDFLDRCGPYTDFDIILLSSSVIEDDDKILRWFTFEINASGTVKD